MKTVYILRMLIGLVIVIISTYFGFTLPDDYSIIVWIPSGAGGYLFGISLAKYKNLNN